MTHRKSAYFFKISMSLIFATCFLPSAARSSKKKKIYKEPRGSFPSFLGLLGPFGGSRGSKFVFYHVLSVSVAPLVSVESAMECQMTCLMKCFCAVSLSGTMRSVTSALLEETATQALSLRTQAFPIFSNISRLPAHVL